MTSSASGTKTRAAQTILAAALLTTLLPVPVGIAQRGDRTIRAVTEKLDPQLVDAGKVKAVVNGVATDTTAASASAQAAQGAVFIERKRAIAQVVAVPDVLVRTPAPNGTSQPPVTLLGDEIVVANANGPVPIRSRVYLSDTSGLTYSGARRTFEGQIGVAFVNADAGADRSPLPKAISLLVRAPGAVISPQPLEVLQFGQWYPVKLSVASPVSPYQVAVTANPMEPGDSVTVAVVRPVVTLVGTARRIVGYGIGKVTVNVAVDNMSDPDGTQILIDTDRGELENGVVILDAQGHGKISLRSAGVGLAHLKPSGLYEGEPIEIQFASPVMFLGLAGAGGLAGAFLKEGRSRVVKRVAIAVVSAVVMTLAYAVGFDWVVRATGWDTLASSGEAVVFVLGFLGSWFGVGVLGAKP